MPDEPTLNRVVRTRPPVLTAFPHWAEDYAKAAKETRLGLPLAEAVTALNGWIAAVDEAGA